MRIYQLVHNLVERYAPMDEKSKNELLLSATDAYNKVKDDSTLIDMENKDIDVYNAAHPDEPKAQLKKKLQHKGIDLCEKWFMRYLFAILFVVLVPLVQNYFFGRKDEGEDIDDEESELEDYMEYKRYKKRMQHG